MEEKKINELSDEALDAAAVSGGLKRKNDVARTDVCSVCGATVTPIVKNGLNYCPNCGNKMH